MKTEESDSATENPSCSARPLTLNRASAMPSLSWCGQLFALPNHAMHPDLLQRAVSMKGELIDASQTGDGRRLIIVNYNSRHIESFKKLTERAGRNFQLSFQLIPDPTGKNGLERFRRLEF